MNAPKNAYPPPILSLIDELQGRGYCVTDRRYDEKRFGNTLIALALGKTHIRFVRDRRRWYVDIGAGSAPAGWFPPDIWIAFLDSLTPALEPSSLDAEVEFVRRRLDEIEATNRSFNDDQLAVLGRLREERAAARQALPPRPFSAES